MNMHFKCSLWFFTQKIHYKFMKIDAMIEKPIAFAVQLQPQADGKKILFRSIKIQANGVK